MCRTPLPSSASYNGMIAPPGYPNTRSTPSARRHCKTMSAPLSIYDLWLRLFGRTGLLRFFGEPGHHGAQASPDFFDGMAFFFFPECCKIAAALLVFFNP